ncbi:hypothetical protein DY000_02033829 [Brassica cretica]|uniref:Disease resistance protein Roq1-like winged-helix domain-containing protein n=1 Tax=Brassica cretica TaxID=69181 RepID=A0ABQ7DH07_BRACR|nr:hypothetical protein DY000_02033829 [Brassica cretica]
MDWARGDHTACPLSKPAMCLSLQFSAEVLGELRMPAISLTDEADMLEKFATDVSNKLNITLSRDFDEIVGLQAHLRKLITLLCFECDEAKMIGIWGPAGIGLCVVGSSLRGESQEEWELQLSRIENNLDRKIEDVLRVGYDRLSKKDKALFLHIACIFNFGSVDHMTSMLADCNMDVKNGLKTLAIRSLVQLHIMDYEMHSLLQQLGRQVVHEQSDEPGKRQFLVEAEEIRHVLANETGTGSVIGISFDMSKVGKFSISGRAFVGMRNLRFLKMYNSRGLRITGHMKYLPHLRLLHWDSYPRKRLPPTFQPQCLVELCMIFSNLEKLWGGIQIEDVPASVAERWLCLGRLYIGSKSLKRLTHVPECVSTLDLSNSDIKKIPDCIIGLPGLGKLKIKNCRKLVSLQGLPPSLWMLDADDCVSLKSVCLSFYKPKSAYITLDDCKCVKSEKDAIRVTSLFYNPMREIRLFNCFSLDEKTRRVIIQQCDYKSVCLPGKEIPPEFTHRAKGNSITISSGTFSASSRFKACLRLSPVEEVSFLKEIVCRVRSKGILINELECYPINPALLSEHLVVFSGALFKEHICCELDATTSEIRFEFNCDYFIECGVQMLAEEGEIKLASSFHDPNRKVRFLNCMKLDEEARRAIIQRWAYKYVCLPGKEVPSEFTHKAKGNSVTISQGTLSASTSFRACILLSPTLQHPPWFGYNIGCRLRSKGILINELECYTGSPLLTKHLLVLRGALFKERRCVEVDSDIQFEFSCYEKHSKIIECGVQIMAEEGESSSSREWNKQSDGAVKVSKDENVIKTNNHTSWWSGLKKLGLRKNKKNQTG